MRLPIVPQTKGAMRSSSACVELESRLDAFQMRLWVADQRDLSPLARAARRIAGGVDAVEAGIIQIPQHVGGGFRVAAQQGKRLFLGDVGKLLRVGGVAF